MLRNHGDCAAGYRTIATVASIDFTDTDVADFQGYTYRVAALGGAGGQRVLFGPLELHRPLRRYAGLRRRLRERGRERLERQRPLS